MVEVEKSWKSYISFSTVYLKNMKNAFKMFVGRAFPGPSGKAYSECPAVLLIDDINVAKMGLPGKGSLKWRCFCYWFQAE